VCNGGTRGQRWRSANTCQLFQHLRDRHRDEELSAVTLRGISCIFVHREWHLTLHLTMCVQGDKRPGGAWHALIVCRHCGSSATSEVYLVQFRCKQCCRLDASVAWLHKQQPQTTAYTIDRQYSVLIVFDFKGFTRRCWVSAFFFCTYKVTTQQTKSCNS
jgi:hypothetical protein